jgi:hypothetical protein
MLICLGAHGAFAQRDVAVRRAVSAASLVVEVKASRLLPPSSRAEVLVTARLKGSPESDLLYVDLDKAPLGLWPKPGETRILCLTKRRTGTYELSSYNASVLDSSEDSRRLVEQAMAVAAPARPPEESPATATPPAAERPPVVEAPPVIPPRPLAPVAVEPSTDTVAGQVAASETVLVGVLTDVRRWETGEAVGSFKVEDALTGFGGYRGPVSVHIPVPVSAGPSELPAAGRYVLFLRGRNTDAGFDVASPVWGARRMTGARDVSELKREVAKAAGSAKKNLTTIQATIAQWESAWNDRDLARCMGCYSRKSPLRQRYERGGEERRLLKEQIAGFRGKARIALQRVDVEGAGGAEEDGAEADVTVFFGLSAAGLEDHRTATMKFVREGGEWLILDEGF